MDRPRRSRYASRDFSVQWKKEVTLGEDQCNGLCSIDSRTIEIREGLPPEFEAEVLVHEVLHQLWNFGGLPSDVDVEEQIVGYFGKALTAHMKENPGLWRYVGSQLRKK